MHQHHVTDLNLSKLRETVEDRGAWHATVQEVRVGHTLVTEQQQQDLDLDIMLLHT